MTTSLKIEALTRDNYESWKLQAEALLIKTDGWNYACGKINKPEHLPNETPEQRTAKDNEIATWEEKDRKARADIILAVSPNELNQIRNCKTSNEVWVKLENIYRSQGPAKKALLLEKLLRNKLSNEKEDMRDHLKTFFEVVDKLADMNVKINDDLLSIMLLHTLPDTFENFACAIKSRDALPTPEILKIKVMEEWESRNQKTEKSEEAGLIARNYQKNNNGKQSEYFPYECRRCHKKGHKAQDCRSQEGGFRASGRKSGYRNNYKFNRNHNNNNNRVGLLAAEESYFVKNGEKVSKWCLDSGATSHLNKNNEEFSEQTKVKGKINLASEEAHSEIKARGTVNVIVDANGEEKHLALNNTLHVPDFRTNLMSVSKITDKGYDVLFQKDQAIAFSSGIIQIPKEKQLFQANREGGLWYVEGRTEEEVAGFAGTAGIKNMSILWHERMGHLNTKYLADAVNKGTIRGINTDKISTEIQCDICIRGKMKRIPFQRRKERSENLLETVSTDICGRMRKQSLSGGRYVITFTDDYSRWTEIKILKTKDEALDAYREYKARVENFHDKKIKFLHDDRGGEYVNAEFNDDLKESGVWQKLTAPYTPQQNGVAERKNDTIIGTARCLLIQSGLPEEFWT